MSNFPEKGLNAAVSRIPQTDYLTATTAAANKFVREEIKRELSKIQPNEKDNSDYATGYSFPTESWVEDWRNSWSWSMMLASQNIGRYLLAAMGKVTTRQPDAGDEPTVYEHVFEPLPFLTTQQLPAYSLLAQLLPAANGINKKYPSMVAKSFKIASSGKAKLDGSVQWEGSGEEVLPSGVTWATHVNEIQGTLNYFFSKQNELIISDTDGSNDSNLKCEIKSSNFSIENDFAEEDYGCPRFVDDDPELGALRSQYLLTNQKFMMDWVLKMRNDNPEYVALLDRHPFKLVQKWVGGVIAGGLDGYNHELEITSYLAKYAAAEDGFEDGMAVVSVKPTMLFNVSANKIVQVKLTNNVASYTT